MHTIDARQKEATSIFLQDLGTKIYATVKKDGIKTKLLALAIHGGNMLRKHWVTSDEFISAVSKRLEKVLMA